MPGVIVLGCGGHGRVIADLCRSSGVVVAGFLDSSVPKGQTVLGATVLGGDELLDDAAFVSMHEFLVGLGNQKLRRKLTALVRSKGGRLATVAHSSAVIAPDVCVGAGTVVMAGGIVNTGSTLGESVIVNTGATVDHDNVLADGVQLCPGVHLAGTVTCGEDAYVGTGAIVIPGCRIGARTIVGAGAVVTCDLPDDVTAVGCPAAIVGEGGPANLQATARR